MRLIFFVLNLSITFLAEAQYPAFIIEQVEERKMVKDGSVISASAEATRYLADAHGNALLIRFPSLEAMRDSTPSQVMQEVFFEAVSLKAWNIHHGRKMAIASGKFAQNLERARNYREPARHEGARSIAGQTCFIVPVWGDREQKTKIGTGCMSPLLRMPLEVEQSRHYQDGTVGSLKTRTLSLQILSPSEAKTLSIPAGYQLSDDSACASCGRK
jgi:hypothetical protein